MGRRKQVRVILGLSTLAALWFILHGVSRAGEYVNNRHHPQGH